MLVRLQIAELFFELISLGLVLIVVHHLLLSKVLLLSAVELVLLCFLIVKNVHSVNVLNGQIASVASVRDQSLNVSRMRSRISLSLLLVRLEVLILAETMQ